MLLILELNRKKNGSVPELKLDELEGSVVGSRIRLVIWIQDVDRQEVAIICRLRW